MRPRTGTRTGTKQTEELPKDLEPFPVDFVGYRLAPDPAQVEAALAHDLPAVQYRLAEVTQALDDLAGMILEVADTHPELARRMQRTLSWVQAVVLPDAAVRTEALVRGLGDDALPGAKHRPGWIRGGRGRAATYQDRYDEWQRAADAIWQKHPSWSVYRVAKELAPKFSRSSHDTIRKHIKRPS